MWRFRTVVISVLIVAAVQDESVHPVAPVDHTHESVHSAAPANHTVIDSEISTAPPVDISDLFFGWMTPEGTTPTATRAVRFVFDNVATPAQCQMLISGARRATAAGRSLSMKHMPEMSYVDFLAVFRNANATEQAALREVREAIRNTITRELRPAEPLMEDTWHITRRMPSKYEGDSHALHADNCGWVYQENACVQKPEFCCSWRSHSAVMFLNDDSEDVEPHFTGGQFFFAEDRFGNRQSPITAKCGRLVSFTSGADNWHGVKHVDSGERYVVAIWYTSDTDHAYDHHSFSFFDGDDEAVPGTCRRGDGA